MIRQYLSRSVCCFSNKHIIIIIIIIIVIIIIIIFCKKSKNERTGNDEGGCVCALVSYFSLKLWNILFTFGIRGVNMFASNIFIEMLFDRFCTVCLFTSKTPKSDLTSLSQNGPPYDRVVHTWPYATIIRNSWNIYYVQLAILEKLLGVRKFLALLSRDWTRWRTRERSKKAITS